MPFYRFHIDVPVAPAVVEERLRAATGNRYDRWIDGVRGMPFYGRLKENTFRIRRNLGYYRNAYLPRLRGKYEACDGGTTVRVTMWMNPLALLLLFFWGALYLAAWERIWPERFATSSSWQLLFLPLAGCAMFFWEARRSRLLLTALLNGTGGQAIELVRPAAGRTVRVLPWVAVALSVALTLTILLWQREHLTRSAAYRQTLQLVRESAAAKEILGEAIEPHGSVRGFVNDREEFGAAGLSISVRGSRGEGIVHAAANRVRGEWRIEQAGLWLKGQTKRIELAPARSRETFSYPARGTVYLLPFDPMSAGQLGPFSDYLGGRLGLRVALLPLASLPGSTKNESTRQLIAERAIDWIEARASDEAPDPDAVVLGVTNSDLDIESSGWNHALNYRIGRFGVVSTVRLHTSSTAAESNPELYTERVRKLLLKNVAMLCYPVSLSADRTSVLANGGDNADDVDEMTEEIFGERGKWWPTLWGAPCFSITRGPGTAESWRVGCEGTPPNDSRLESFDHYTGTTSMVLARTDFAAAGERRLAFIRKHWTKDEKSRSFGAGGNSSFGVYLEGDSRSLSWMRLVHEDSSHVSFRQKMVSAGGPGMVGARVMSDPFSLADLQWNGKAWELKTTDGWKYRFPFSEQESVLAGIEAGKARVTIRRGGNGQMERVEGLAGGSIEFESDDKGRITQARQKAGHSIRYAYTETGRLARVDDSETGSERYEYDEAGRLTKVLGENGRSDLTIRYGYSGEIKSETLADGRELKFRYEFNPTRGLNSVTLVDDRGFETVWSYEHGGYAQSLPKRTITMP